MNIIAASDRKIKFEYIAVGDAFKFGNAYLMKIEIITDGIEYKNAVNLRLGSAECFNDNEFVEPIDCDLVVK